MNTTTITGRLTADPELRFTPSGTAVATLRVANNDRDDHPGQHIGEPATPRRQEQVITQQLRADRHRDDDIANEKVRPALI